MSVTYPPAASSGVFSIGGGLPVTRLGFGALRITGPGAWGGPPDRDEAIAVLRRAAELGVDFIDTADSYGPAVSEDLIRAALHPYDGIAVATKGGYLRTGPGQWHALGKPEYLRQCVEMSLRRLGVDTIDLYQLHQIDPEIPLADQVGELDAMRREGKIRYLGLSEVSVPQIGEARLTAPIASVQNQYNLTSQAVRGRARLLRAGGAGLHPVGPDRVRTPGRGARPAGHAGQADRRGPGPAGPGLAAAAVRR